jgi:hypothetical protein
MSAKKSSTAVATRPPRTTQSKAADAMAWGMVHLC